MSAGVILVFLAIIAAPAAITATAPSVVEKDMTMMAESNAASSSTVFRFADVHGDGMVLQAAPKQAMVWGFCDADAKVTVSFQNHTIQATVEKTDARVGSSGPPTWRALLPATGVSFAGDTVTATDGTTTATLSGVLFGDVWLCSGQSNMQYPLGVQPTCWNQSNINCTISDNQCSYGCVNQSATEIAAMADYDAGMRLFIVQGKGYKTPQAEMAATTGWLKPSAMGGQFSASCWFFGRDVFAELNADPATKRPVGLIETNVGGTPDQHWSSPDALAQCTDRGEPWDFPKGFTDSVLWNGFVVPLLRTVHSGTVWYQGEANSRADGRQYNCSFPSMIEDWRSKFHEFTDGATDAAFPFGWAQLNSNGLPTNNYLNPKADSTAGTFGEWDAGFPSIRLAETHTLSLPNTFQAVILDTPIASGSVHSPWKQPVGQRLARGGLAVAYGRTALAAVDPVAASARVADATVVVTLRKLGTRGAAAPVGALGFEVLGSDGVWHSTPVVAARGADVTVGPAPAGASAVRYLWYASPCGLQPYQCAVYTDVEPIGALSGERQDFLPLGPFVMAL